MGFQIGRRRRAARIMQVVLLVMTTFGALGAAQESRRRQRGSESNAPLNLYEKHKDEYVESAKPVLVDVGQATYLTVTGHGEPGGAAFRGGVGALYRSAYAIKMKHKFAGRDYVVCPIEGQWWGTRSTHSFLDEPKEDWNWKLLVRIPDFVSKADVVAVSGPPRAPGSPESPPEVKREVIREGKCVQVLYIGPYDQENETIAAMHAFAQKKGLTLSGPHHELYLSDPNSTAPEKLRTLLRQPVK